MNIALDIDGTITQAPDFFAFLSEAVREAGDKVIVVTSRANLDEVALATRKELDFYDIDIDGLYIIPDDPDDFIPCPHPELVDYQRYLWQKVAICTRENVSIIFEDSPPVIDLFKKYAPEIQVFQVR